jgi:plastocyanin
MKRSFLLAAILLVTNGASPPPYQVVPVPNGGSIVGKISYAGPKVDRKEIMPTVDATVCGQHGMIESDELVVSSSGGLQYAVVRLTNIKAGRPASEIPPTMLVQKGCMFSPHVFAVATGTLVRERNTDGILHNVHTHSSRNPSVNFAHPPSKPEVDLASFGAPESIKVTCDVHNWMTAWIWVSSHPYIAVTGPDGTFKITGVPPGQYKVEVWHETLGKSSHDVTVTAGKETRLDVSLPVPTTRAVAPAKK